MNQFIVWSALLALLCISSQAFAAVNNPEELPPPDENGICIPTTPIGFSKECDGPNPPAYCGDYDPEYGDWFVPEQSGVFELLLRGMKHVYTD